MPRMTPAQWKAWQKETMDPEVPPNDLKAQRERMDLGLALLSIARAPGAAFSREEVAAWCGVSWSMIGWYEKKAIEKLRKRLRQMNDPRLIEAMQHYLEVMMTERKPATPTSHHQIRGEAFNHE